MQCARQLLFSLACLGLPAAACSSDGGAHPQRPRSLDEGPRIMDEGLCPSCGPLVGGDTSDFGGGGGGCPPGEPRPLPPQEALALLDQIQGMLGSFETRVGWVNLPTGSAWQEEPEPAFPPAVLRATVERSGEPELATFVRSDNPNDIWSKTCPDYARVPIRLAVEISDGTLRAELSGYLRPGERGSAWNLRAHSVVAASASTLDLKVDGRVPDRVFVFADWTYLQQFTGRLDFQGLNRRIVTGPEPFPATCGVADGGAADSGAAEGGTSDAGCGARTYEYWESVSLGPTAHLPFGRCPGGSLPVEHDAPLEWLGGETVNALFERARSEIHARAPERATWCDQTEAELRVQLGPLTPESACRDQSAGFSFAADGRAQSADGRLDKQLVRGFLALDPQTHDLASIALYDAAWLFTASYDWSSDGQLAPGRSWSVFTDDARGTRSADCLRWSDEEEGGCLCLGRAL